MAVYYKNVKYDRYKLLTIPIIFPTTIRIVLHNPPAVMAAIEFGKCLLFTQHIVSICIYEDGDWKGGIEITTTDGKTHREEYVCSYYINYKKRDDRFKEIVHIIQATTCVTTRVLSP